MYAQSRDSSVLDLIKDAPINNIKLRRKLYARASRFVCDSCISRWFNKLRRAYTRFHLSRYWSSSDLLCINQNISRDKSIPRRKVWQITSCRWQYLARERRQQGEQKHWQKAPTQLITLAKCFFFANEILCKGRRLHFRFYCWNKRETFELSSGWFNTKLNAIVLIANSIKWKTKKRICMKHTNCFIITRKPCGLDCAMIERCKGEVASDTKSSSSRQVTSWESFDSLFLRSRFRLTQSIESKESSTPTFREAALSYGIS